MLYSERTSRPGWFLVSGTPMKDVDGYTMDTSSLADVLVEYGFSDATLTVRDLRAQNLSFPAIADRLNTMRV